MNILANQLFCNICKNSYRNIPGKVNLNANICTETFTVFTQVRGRNVVRLIQIILIIRAYTLPSCKHTHINTSKEILPIQLLLCFWQYLNFTSFKLSHTFHCIYLFVAIILEKRSMFMYRAEENPAFQTCLKLIQKCRKGVQKLLLKLFYQLLSLFF